MIMRCQRCDRPMKDRLVTEEFSGTECHVKVTGIPAGVCSYCGYRAMDADALEEIEMYLGPVLAGGVGMRMLGREGLTIDLGHSMHPSAIDIASPSFSAGLFSGDIFPEQGMGELSEDPPAAPGEARAA